MKLRKPVTVLVSFFFPFLSGAQVPEFLDFHVGFGFGMTVSGLPSQLSLMVARSEDYIENTTNERGFPFGTSFFIGLGYRIHSQFSLGLEYGFGYNIDMGISDMKIGKVVPPYVMDSFDTIKRYLKSPSWRAWAFLGKKAAPGIYKGMTAKNNEIKGSYFDQQFLLYFKYIPNWGGLPTSFQIGIGLKMIHILEYIATQSKDPRDYIRSDGHNLDSTIMRQIMWNLISVWASQPLKIPFPIKRQGGSIFMYQNQLLFDNSFRLNIHLFYIDVNYSTNFYYIHNTKVTLGVAIDSSIFNSFLNSKS